MEITFTPGLSAAKGRDEETTLEKYERKMKEKRKKRKEEVKEKDQAGKSGVKDDFFAVDSDDDGENAEPATEKVGKKGKMTKNRQASSDATPRHESTAEELALLAVSDNPNADPKHFNLKSVVKAEKKSKLKGKKKKDKKKADNDDNEIQEDFAIDVKDDRFKALHEDHTFAIDPTNPQYVFLCMLRCVIS